MSGLPVYDRERAFRGYRGFGVCRDIGRLNALAQAVPIEAAAAAAAKAPDAAAEPAPLPGEDHAPSLSPVERHAFYELSRRLAGRIAEADTAVTHEDGVADADPEATGADPWQPDEPVLLIPPDARPFLDRLPIGILIYRLNDLLYANRAFFDWAGHETLDALTRSRRTRQPADRVRTSPSNGGRRQQAACDHQPGRPNASAEASLLQVPWDGESAFALLTTAAQPRTRRQRPTQHSSRRAHKQTSLRPSSTPPPTA